MKTPCYLTQLDEGLINTQRVSAPVKKRTTLDGQNLVKSLECLWIRFGLLISPQPHRATILPILFAAVAGRAVLFSRRSLAAGGLASGRLAHNPQQSSSHHFIFPVLWSSLASVCRYDNFACECHWPPITKFLFGFTRWETRILNASH